MADDEGHDGSSPWRRLGFSFGQLAVALVAVVVLGLGAGWLFGRGSPQRAASLLVDDFVTEEPVTTDDSPPADVTAPTSGRADSGRVRCGISDDPVDVDDQLASLRAGVVVLQYDPDRLAEGRALDRLTDLTADDRSRSLVAPNDDLSAAVVATAWGRRLPLREVNRELLGAFVTAYAGQGPTAPDCDPERGG